MNVLAHREFVVGTVEFGGFEARAVAGVVAAILAAIEPRQAQAHGEHALAEPAVARILPALDARAHVGQAGLARGGGLRLGGVDLAGHHPQLRLEADGEADEVRGIHDRRPYGRQLELRERCVQVTVEETVHRQQRMIAVQRVGAEQVGAPGPLVLHAEQLDLRVRDEIGLAGIAQLRGQPIGQAEPVVDLAQGQSAGIPGEPFGAIWV